MKRTIFQHIPNSVETDLTTEQRTFVFETTKELLDIPFVKKFSNYKDFHRYTISSEQKLLMAEYKGGFEWWVVGRINDVTEINLPEFKVKYQKEPIKDNTERSVVKYISVEEYLKEKSKKE